MAGALSVAWVSAGCSSGTTAIKALETAAGMECISRMLAVASFTMSILSVITSYAEVAWFTKHALIDRKAKIPLGVLQAKLMVISFHLGLAVEGVLEGWVAMEGGRATCANDRRHACATAHILAL